jgi:hypothetical protein
MQNADVFGETPKMAVETTALPKATASFRLRVADQGDDERMLRVYLAVSSLFSSRLWSAIS